MTTDSERPVTARELADQLSATKLELRAELKEDLRRDYPTKQDLREALFWMYTM